MQLHSYSSIRLRGRKRKEPLVKSPINGQEGLRHVDQWCPLVLLKGYPSHETEVRSFINAEIALQHATTRLVFQEVDLTVSGCQVKNRKLIFK
mgnify:CR=1 FL=1